MNYQDKLQDPRWERFRYEVLEDAGYMCARCRRPEREVQLHVHHPFYRRGAEPWEYDVREVRCLCDCCHKREHGIKDDRDDEVPF